jgi:hypothetical protein
LLSNHPAGFSDAWGVGQRQILLGGNRFGRDNFDFTRLAT